MVLDDISWNLIFKHLLLIVEARRDMMFGLDGVAYTFGVTALEDMTRIVIKCLHFLFRGFADSQCRGQVWFRG